MYSFGFPRSDFLKKVLERVFSYVKGPQHDINIEARCTITNMVPNACLRKYFANMSFCTDSYVWMIYKHRMIYVQSSKSMCGIDFKLLLMESSILMQYCDLPGGCKHILLKEMRKVLRTLEINVLLEVLFIQYRYHFIILITKYKCIKFVIRRNFQFMVYKSV